MKRESYPGQQDWGLVCLWASQINNFEVQRSEMGAPYAGPPLLLPLACCLQRHKIHLWLKTWIVVCKGKYFGPLSHFRWHSDFCWALVLPEELASSVLCFLVLFLPGRETMPWTRFVSVICRSCDGTPFEFLQVCRARASQRQLIGKEAVGYSPAELACFTKLISSYGYKQPFFHTVTYKVSVQSKWKRQTLQTLK